MNFNHWKIYNCTDHFSNNLNSSSVLTNNKINIKNLVNRIGHFSYLIKLRGFFFKATNPKRATPKIPTPAQILFTFSLSFFNLSSFCLEYPSSLSYNKKLQFLKGFHNLWKQSLPVLLIELNRKWLQVKWRQIVSLENLLTLFFRELSEHGMPRELLSC